MALKITDNFNYTGRKPNFQRDQFATTSEMNAYTVCDEGHISYNLQDNKHYSFKNGAWSVLQTGGGGSSYTHPSSHPASIITYDSSETYESGNVGYEIKQLATSLAAKYVKPGAGIPKTDLANDVQTSLGYADDYNTNKSSFLTSTALETALEGLSPYSAGTGVSITTVSGGKQIAIDSSVYKVKDVQNASGTSLVNNGIATIPNATITSIKDSGGNDLTITNGAVTLPAIPTVPITQINKSDNTQLSPVSGVVTLPAIPSSAADISFDDSVTQFSTQETAITNVQSAINQLSTGIAGLTCRLKIHLTDSANAPVANKQVSVSAYYRGNAYDLSPQYTSDYNGFKTNSNGYVINNNQNDYIILPLGATYTISYFDISVSTHITPEDSQGIADSNIKTVTGVYQILSDNEYVNFYVQMPNTNPNIANTNDKIINIDFYSSTTEHSLQYVCKLRSNGTVKAIYQSDGTTPASFDGVNAVATGNEPVMLPVPKNTRYLASLQEFNPNLPSDQQRYVKSADVVYKANKSKRTIKFTYIDRQVGLFLLIADSTKTRGYRECMITNIDTTENKIVFKDNNVEYEAYLESGVLYKIASGDTVAETWEETIIGYGIRTSSTINATNNDTYTQTEYPDCSFFLSFVPNTFTSQMTAAGNAVELPVDFGGLYLTRCLANLSVEETSPAALTLLDGTTKDITLDTPNNGTYVIKGFVPSSDQIVTIRGVLANIKNLSTILRGVEYSFAVGTSYRAWSSTISTTNKSQFAIYDRTTLASANPSIFTGNGTYIIIPIYPF